MIDCIYGFLCLREAYDLYYIALHRDTNYNKVERGEPKSEKNSLVLESTHLIDIDVYRSSQLGYLRLGSISP